MLNERTLAALAARIGEEEANIVSELHEKHNGEIALKIKNGNAYVCRPPTFDDMQRHMKAKDTMQSTKELAVRCTLHPSPAAAEAAYEKYPGLLSELADAATALTQADEDFDLEGN